MTRITPSDQVLLLLRAHLQQLSRQRAEKTAARKHQRLVAQSPLERLQALKEFNDWNEESRQKALIRSILSEELGPALANEPRFISICNDIHRLLSDDAEGRALLARALAQLMDR